MTNFGGKSNAKNRRERENTEFWQLGRLLPLPSAITCQLDKASVIRLTKSYLHLTSVFPQGFDSGRICPKSNGRPVVEMVEVSSHLMQTMEGFVFVTDPAGKIMYISETASVHLGLSQVELIGNSLFDYLHPNDYQELAAALKNTTVDGTLKNEEERIFFLRIKCVLPKRNAGLTDHGYKVIHCSGYFRRKRNEGVGVIAIGYTLPTTAATEVRLSATMFMFRTTTELKIVFLDSRASDLTGFELQELLDTSVYQRIHVCDTGTMVDAHRTVMEKQQVTTQYFRFLTKHGGWLWMQAQMTMVAVPRATRPPCVVFICSTLGQPEMTQEILSVSQMATCSSTNGGRSSATVIKRTSRSSDDAHNNTRQHDPNFLGAYSEAFYGPHGMGHVQRTDTDLEEYPELSPFQLVHRPPHQSRSSVIMPQCRY